MDAEAASAEYGDFLGVRKNRTACLAFLVKLCHAVERSWETAVERGRLLRVLRRCLAELEGHTDSELHELSRLAPKMKNLDYDLNHFLGLFLPIERKHTRGLRDDQFLILDTDRADQERPQRAPVPLYLVLQNIRSAFNVGAIFRTADCLKVDRIYLCGYTATPDVENTAKTTMGAHEHVQWRHHRHIEDVLEELKAENVRIVALETVVGSHCLYEYAFKREPTAIILGNERYGIEADVLQQCDSVVHIPTYGMKNSLNVGVALGICGYEVLRQWEWQKDGVNSS